jgi:hypothetical protein
MTTKMSNLTIPLGIDSLRIISQTVDTQGNIIIDVESTKLETAWLFRISCDDYAKA